MCRGSHGRCGIHVHHLIHDLVVLSASVGIRWVQCPTHSCVFSTKWSLLADWKPNWAPSSTYSALPPLLMAWRPLHHVKRGALPHNLRVGNFSLLIAWLHLVGRPLVGASWILALLIHFCRSLAEFSWIELLLTPVGISPVVGIVIIRSCLIPRIQSHISRIWISLVDLRCSLSICRRPWDILAMRWLGITRWMVNWQITWLLASLPLIRRSKATWIMHLSILLSKLKKSIVKI